MSNKSSKDQTKSGKPDPHISPIAGFIFAICLIIGVLGSIYLGNNVSDISASAWVTFWLLIGIYILFALKIASQWEKAVVLRLGKFKGLKGPGLFWIIPGIEAVSTWVDHRVMVTPFAAQKTLTKDTVPVDVDAVLFWLVWDAEKAALEVKNYEAAVDWAAQTALRDITGRMMLADLLVGRSSIDAQLQKVIDERTTPWRQARVILGESEKQIAESFAEASKSYVNNPTALHLRAMNMLFEGLKEKGALVIVPSSAVDTMNLGGISGMVSLAQNNLPKE
jgi:regulator of protease activity HflC (stomatin/prohibitin superfamily)